MFVKLYAYVPKRQTVLKKKTHVVAHRKKKHQHFNRCKSGCILILLFCACSSIDCACTAQFTVPTEPGPIP